MTVSTSADCLEARSASTDNFRRPLCYTAQVMDDAQLVAQAQAGSQDAFCELVERYHARVVSIALGLLGHVEEANDASQEAFIKAYRALPQFRRESRFATWLYRIVVNECQDVLRARTRARRWQWRPAPAAADAEIAEDFLELAPSPDPSARDAAHDAEVARALSAAIRRLSPRQRSVVTLRYLEGMSVEEVAQILGCAAGTVKAQLARALRHLRAHLNGVVEPS